MAEHARGSATRGAHSSRGHTREKILRVAERLFAREGVERVTLRQIARAAGQGNVAAVQYHFGGKDALLAEIVARHQSGIDDARRELLDQAERDGGGHDLPSLIHILVSPLAQKLDSRSGRAYLQLQAQRNTPDALLPATRLLAERMARALAPAPPEPARDRLATLLLFHGLADRARQEEARTKPDVDRPHFIQTLERALLGLYRAST